MSAPSVTYSFTNGTTSDATQVNTNFTDLINGASDGTRDYTIGTLIVNGATTLKGTVNLGDSTADDISVVGSIAATIPFKTNATYNIGAATLAPLSIYLGNGTKSTRIMAGTVGTSWTLTLPNDVPAVTGKTLIANTSGTLEFRYPNKFVAAQTTAYTATGDETIIPCTPAASFDLTLPDVATHSGKTFQIYRTDNDPTKVVTIKNASAVTITAIHTQNERVWVTSDGTNWAVSNRYIPSVLSTFTMTLAGSTSAPTKATTNTEISTWRRVGDCIEIFYNYEHSSNVGAAAGSGTYLYTLPHSLTIDSAKMTVSTDEDLGVAGAGSMSTSADTNLGIVKAYSTTQLSLVIGDSDSATSHHGSGFGAWNSAALNVSFKATVPVSGWNG